MVDEQQIEFIRTFGELLRNMIAGGQSVDAGQIYVSLRTRGLTDEEIETLPVRVTHEAMENGGRFTIGFEKDKLH